MPLSLLVGLHWGIGSSYLHPHCTRSMDLDLHVTTTRSLLDFKISHLYSIFGHHWLIFSNFVGLKEFPWDCRHYILPDILRTHPLPLSNHAGIQALLREHLCLRLYLRNEAWSLATLAQLVGYCLTKQKVMGSVPNWGAGLVCNFSIHSGHVQETTDWCFSLTLMFSLPLFLPPYPSL